VPVADLGRLAIPGILKLVVLNLNYVYCSFRMFLQTKIKSILLLTVENIHQGENFAMPGGISILFLTTFDTSRCTKFLNLCSFKILYQGRRYGGSGDQAPHFEILASYF